MEADDSILAGSGDSVFPAGHIDTPDFALTAEEAAAFEALKVEENALDVLIAELVQRKVRFMGRSRNWWRTWGEAHGVDLSKVGAAYQVDQFHRTVVATYHNTVCDSCARVARLKDRGLAPDGSSLQ